MSEAHRKEKRMHMLMWAELTFGMRKVPREMRELASWRYLLEWAALGGDRESGK